MLFLSGDASAEESQYYSPGSPEFWIYVASALALCCFAGLCSGLTVGYLSIEEMDLEIKRVNGSEEEKQQANTILPVIHKHHRLIATLLMSNALAMQTLPIVMHKIVPELIAILFSTIIVVVVGQILPQAVCTGPNKLKIAQACVPLINGLMMITAPFSYPMGIILDKILGQHQRQRFVKKDMRTLFSIHQEDEGLNSEEVKLLLSILQLRQQRVEKVMVPLQKLYMLDANKKISKDLLQQIKDSKYSNMPVFEGHKCKLKGIIKAKQFANRRQFNLGKKIINLKMDKVLLVYSATNLMNVLMLMQEKQTNVAFVSVDKRPQKLSNLQSIYYSKKQMLCSKEDVQIKGAVFLNDLFRELADEYFQEDQRGLKQALL